LIAGIGELIETAACAAVFLSDSGTADVLSAFGVMALMMVARMRISADGLNPGPHSREQARFTIIPQISENPGGNNVLRVWPCPR
jgi:hypothetical protein